MSDTPPSAADPAPAHRTPAMLVVVAWLFVGIPAAWGVSQTFRQALKLVQHAPVAKPAPPAGGTTSR